jgi:exodeoxyribonuclease VII small subunit
MTDDPAAEPPLAYSDALAELKTIIRGIESEDIDLDDLGEQVERAATLIRQCRATLTRAELTVRQVLDDLDDDGEDKADAP